MANAIYPIYKQALLDGLSDIDLNDGTVKVALVDTGTYTYNAAHDFADDITGGVGTDQRITTPTVANGTFDGDNLTYTAVTGNSVEALVIYRHNSGANTTWKVVLYLDTSVTGLPVTPNGGDITVTWNASGIFTVSDARLKEDIRKVDEIGRLNVYEYRYRGQRTVRRGLLAQQVERVAPQAVIQLGRIKAVDYHRAIASAQRAA